MTDRFCSPTCCSLAERYADRIAATASRLGITADWVTTMGRCQVCLEPLPKRSPVYLSEQAQRVRLVLRALAESLQLETEIADAVDYDDALRIARSIEALRREGSLLADGLDR